MQGIDLGIIGVEEEHERHERADAAANRRLILETAEQLFAREGVAAVTMAEIAAEAGVGKGTLYRRFDNKAELALALMDSQTSAFQDEVLAQLRAFGEEGMPFMTRLDYFLDALVLFTDRHLPLLSVVQSTGLLDEDREQSRPYHWQYQTVSGLLGRAIAAGELAETIDVAYTADALLAPLRADIFRFQRQARDFNLERISSGLRGLAAALR
jgi:AcrR family transcriptional regulator